MPYFHHNVIEGFFAKSSAQDCFKYRLLFFLCARPLSLRICQSFVSFMSNEDLNFPRISRSKSSNESILVISSSNFKDHFSYLSLMISSDQIFLFQFSVLIRVSPVTSE